PRRVPAGESHRAPRGARAPWTTQLKQPMAKSVMTRHQQRQLAIIARGTEALAEFFDQRDAARLVPDMTRPFRTRRRALADVMHERGEAHALVRGKPHRLIDDQHDMHARIDFRMVLGRLRYAIKCIELRKQARERAAR